MNDSHRLIKKYTITQDYKIKKICAPLQECLGIPYYSWYRIDKAGNFAFLSNYTESVDFFFSEKLHMTDPFLVHPNLRPSGYLLTDAVEENDYVEVIEKRFKLRNIFSIAENKGDYFEAHLFCNKSTDKVSVNTYLTNLDLLKTFSHHFTQTAQHLIGRMIADDFNLHREKGDSFLKPTLPLPSRNNAAVDKFLKRISPLSKRERECLELFRRGNSAQATGAILGLSKRTVEFYFENIKNKLDCHSKRDLLDY